MGRRLNSTFHFANILVSYVKGNKEVTHLDLILYFQPAQLHWKNVTLGFRTICNSRCSIKCVLFNELCIPSTVELYISCMPLPFNIQTVQLPLIGTLKRIFLQIRTKTSQLYAFLPMLTLFKKLLREIFATINCNPFSAVFANGERHEGCVCVYIYIYIYFFFLYITQLQHQDSIEQGKNRGSWNNHCMIMDITY